MMILIEIVVIGHVRHYFARISFRIVDAKLRRYAVFVFGVLFYRVRKCLMLLIHITLLVPSFDACKSTIG